MHSALGGSRGSALLVTARLSESDGPKTNRGRARAIATTGALCSPALGEPDAYPAVSGGAGGAETQNAPNGTAALSFVANSEAARYVFVVVVVHDAMDRGRRYDTFVLACRPRSTGRLQNPLSGLLLRSQLKVPAVPDCEFDPLSLVGSPKHVPFLDAHPSEVLPGCL